MVSSSEYHNLKNLWEELADFKPCDKEALETHRKDTLSGVDKNLKTLEEKVLTGRWVRRFFESEFQNRFDQIALTRHLIEKKSISEEDRIAFFWKEIDFCQEGFLTLDRVREYDAWLSHLVKERTKRTFHLIKGINFQKRLDHLKISREAYRKKLIQLLDSLASYLTKAKAESRPRLIGKGKGEVTKILVRPPQGNWTQLTTRKEKELYETDLIEIQAKEDKKITLQDRRYIILEAGAIWTGWELEPKTPETLHKEIARLIEQLGNNDWHLRETATEELIKIGKPAIPAVKEALKHKDPEIRMRANLVLKQIDPTLSDPSRIKGKVLGKVLAVSQTHKIVIISIGTDAGVRVGMEFNVYRGNTFVGKIRVDSVDKEYSSAMNIPESMKDQVHEGNDVTTGQ